uniref:Uncharacterized protein n=1 Tax=Pseudonaja textilis TaxID=8673 RepID=A0A670YMD2_PSETE
MFELPHLEIPQYETKDIFFLNKELLAQTLPPELAVHKFQHILHVLNTNFDGWCKIAFKGMGRHYAHMVLQKADTNLTKMASTARSWPIRSEQKTKGVKGSVDELKEWKLVPGEDQLRINITKNRCGHGGMNGFLFVISFSHCRSTKYFIFTA